MARQGCTREALTNPYGMDPDCQNCPALATERERIVHGYGDVAAEFLIVGYAPSAAAEAAGIPFADGPVFELLAALGLCTLPDDDADGAVTDGDDPASVPIPENAYLTYLTRCRHPDRGPTDAERTNCEPFLNAELRTINPEIIVPVGQPALRALATEYTTRAPEEFDIERDHATSIRGRGFELVPLRSAPTEAQTTAFLDRMRDLMDGDYRQTKGRRER